MGFEFRGETPTTRLNEFYILVGDGFTNIVFRRDGLTNKLYKNHEMVIL